MENSKAYVKKVEEVNEEDVYDILQKIEESNKEIDNFRIQNDVYSAVRSIKGYKENKNEIMKRILALIASLTVFLGASKGYYELSKKVLGDNFQTVNSVTLTYNEETGYSKQEEYIPIKYAKEETYIKVYEPWNMKKEREIRTYDISSLSDMDLEEYLKLNLEDMGIDYTSVFETLSGSVLLNEKEVREVVKKMVYYDQTKNDVLSSFEAILIYIIILLAIIYVDIGILDADSYWFVLGNICSLKVCLEETDFYKRNIKSEFNRDLLENMCHLTDMIKENNELRDKFVEEFNKLKCSDPSEIMEKYRALCKEADIDKFEKENSLILKELKKRGINGKQ